MSRPTHIPVSAAFRLLGLSERQGWYRVRQGCFPPLVQRHDPATGCVSAHVSLADYRDVYGVVTDAQLAMAMQRPKPATRKWPQKISHSRMRFLLSERDVAWKKFLHHAGYTGPLPNVFDFHNLQGE